MSSVSTKVISTNRTLKLRSRTENIEFDADGSVILPSNCDFSACSSAINAEVDLSSKQDLNAKLTQLSGLSGSENQVIAFNGDGELVAINQASAPSYNAPLSESGGVVSFDDTDFLKSADLSVSVQPYDATILKSADIGVSVAAHGDYIESSAIGDTIQAKNEHLDEFIALHGVAWNQSIPYYNAANNAFELTDANTIQGWGNMQEASNALSQISALTPSNGHVIKYDGNSQVWTSGTAPAPSNMVATDADSSISATLTVSNLVVASYQQHKNAGQASFTEQRVYNTTASNDTEKSLGEYPLPNNQLMYIAKATVNAYSSSGNYAQHEISCVVKNGSVASGSYQQSDLYTDLALNELKFDISSSTLRVRVRSHSSQNVRFHTFLEVNAVEAISA